MKRLILHMALVSVAALCFGTHAAAQNMPERSLVRKGNRQFARERYEQSADSYRRALLNDSTSFEARYDLGNALLRMAMADSTAMNDPQSAAAKMSAGYISQAEGMLQSAAADSLRSDAERAEAYYNLGNTQFAQRKLQEALKSYRRSLTLNPDDMEAKYNYAYTKKLLENQDQNQNDQNQDQNQDQNDQNQDQQQNQNDQNQNQNQDGDGRNDDSESNNDQNDDGSDKNDNGRNDGKDDKKDSGQNNPRPRSGMSEQQQQQLLDAIQAQEDKTQEKLDEKAKGVVIRGRKNW